MIYTSNDVIQLIYNVLESVKSDLDIDGDIYKITAPTNSKKVNIVVNAIATDTETLQRSMINVNSYIPNIDVSLDGTITSMPDFEKIDTLDKKLSAIFAEYYGSDFNAYYVDSKTFSVDNNTMLNLKLRVNLFNNN